MTEPRLAWEPESLVPLEEFEQKIVELTDGKGGVSLLKNGTVLFFQKTEDDEQSALRATHELKEMYNFEVTRVDVGGFIVSFHNAVCVYVSDDELKVRIDEIADRLGELIFPGEGKIIMPPDVPDECALIGAYARGKLQYDAHNFAFYKRI